MGLGVVPSRGTTCRRGLLAACVAVLAGAPGWVQAQGTLEGRVRAQDTGEPLAGVQVSLADVGLGGTTGPGGQYFVGEIPAGTHTVEVRLIGYGVERREVTIADGETTRLDVLLAQAAIALEGVVAVGSRARPRTATESMVPIDAIASADFIDQGDTDLGDLLRTVVPSYNVNPQATGDAARIVRPANLRGLAPDHTLILVNGKRRHRGAVIAWIGNGVSDGAQGADVSAIPAIALRQVEVLRDGASAQYGSDAIAGVLNFQLKDDRSGGAIDVRGGRFLDGGGESYTVSGNIGLPLGDNGFANLSAEYGAAEPTSRSVQRNDALVLVAAGNSYVRDPAQIWGAPSIADDTKLWGNFGYLFGGSAEVQLYGHANYNSERIEGGFFFRNPNTRAGVFSLDGGETLLIGDALDAQDGVLDGSAGCPIVRVTNGLPEQAALARVFSDPNCFSFQERFPGGFTPQFGADATDGSVVAGIKGQSGSVLWDAGTSLGYNHVDYYIYNTVNASLGPATPIEFKPGVNRQQEFNAYVDVAYAVSSKLNVAGGAEYRDERFEIGLGDQASWEIGPYAAQGFSAGSNGFPGFSPIAQGVWHRSNYAVYADAELADDATDRWGLGGAVRFEDFQDFGITFNGKVAARLALGGGFALRGSTSTGFRAPTPGQQNAFNVSTQFDRALMDLVNNGTIPSTSEVAKLRGGVALEAEKSVNMGFGAVLDRGSFSATADYFRIVLSDRIALTQVFKLTTAEQTRLVAEGITSAGNLQNFRFFTNNFQSRTQGLDFVATWAPPVGGDAEISVAFNHTRTKVTKHDPDVLDAVRIRQLQEGLPRTRWNVTARRTFGGVAFLGRVSSYAGWFDARDDRPYGGKMLVDLEASYAIGESLRLTVGGDNALNNYPDVNPDAGFSGNQYSPTSPFGSNGGYYYARLGWRWK